VQQDGKLNPDQELCLPSLTPVLIDFARSLDCNWIGAVRVDAKPHCAIWDCHNNTITYTEWYGGNRVLGYYFLQHPDSNRIVAIQHSVVRTESGNLIDITPFPDDRKINMFAVCNNQVADYSQQQFISN
jgi:hypothetical protein